MYIIDDDNKKNLDLITLLLDKNEMKQLLTYAHQLLEYPDATDHCHLCSEDYQTEVVLCLYDPETLKNVFAPAQEIIDKSDKL